MLAAKMSRYLSFKIIVYNLVVFIIKLGYLETYSFKLIDA